MFRVTVFGASLMDIKAFCEAEAPGGCSPGHVYFAVGGTARNVAENLSRLSLETILLSAVGLDDYGDRVIRQTALAGVTLTHMLLSQTGKTGTHLAVRGKGGRLLASVNDTSILDELSPEHVNANDDLLHVSDLVVADATAPKATLQRLHQVCRQHERKLVWAASPGRLARRILPFVEGSFLVACNAGEAQALTGIDAGSMEGARKAAAALRAMGTHNALVTLGPEGVHLLMGEEALDLPPVTKDVVDTSGAGDAFLAGVLYGLLQSLPPLKMLEIGQHAANLTLDTLENVHPKLNLEYIHANIT